jgi:hypothetical protein
MKNKFLILIFSLLIYLVYYFYYRELQNKYFGLSYMLLFLLTVFLPVNKTGSLSKIIITLFNLTFVTLMIYEKTFYSSISVDGKVLFLPLLITSIFAFRKTKVS